MLFHPLNGVQKSDTAELVLQLEYNELTSCLCLHIVSIQNTHCLHSLHPHTILSISLVNTSMDTIKKYSLDLLLNTCTQVLSVDRKFKFNVLISQIAGTMFTVSITFLTKE